MIKELTIDSFTSVITGGTPSTGKEEFWNNGDIPWLNSGELKQNIITKSSNFITESGLKNSSTKLMPTDTILIALTGTTTGKVGYLTFEACANQSVTGILPSDHHVPKYLYYYLNSIRKKVINDAYGGAQPHISQAYVKKIKIPLPSLETQKRIAQILDDAATLRDKTEQLLKEYDSLAQSTFLEMFGDPIINPKNWDVKNLGALINIKHGFAFKSDFFDTQGDYVLLTPGNFNEQGGYKDQLTKQKYYNGEFPKEYLLEPKEMLIAMTEQALGLLGSALFVPENGKYLHNQRLGLVRYKGHLNPMYLFYVLKNNNVRLRIQNDSTGTKVKHTSPKKIMSINIAYPNIDLQNQFAERIGETGTRRK